MGSVYWSLVEERRASKIPELGPQFQKGYRLTQFVEKYGTEDRSVEALFRWRWPNGFVCSQCEHCGFWCLQRSAVSVSWLPASGLADRGYDPGQHEAALAHMVSGDVPDVSFMHLPRYLAEFSYRFNQRFLNARDVPTDRLHYTTHFSHL